VLVVSTDPAHSLGDALATRLGVRPTRIRAMRHAFDAVELDAPRALARWVDEHRAALGDVFEHGTWLDRDDVDALLDLSIPGVDELVGLIEIDRLATDARVKPPYDLVVVDTAPTGHTLRLLGAPELVAAVADVLDALQEEHRLIREQLARVGRPEAADRLIAEIGARAAEIAQRLRDRAHTAFYWVTLPEPLSVAESEDALAALDAIGVPIAEVVVNRVLTYLGPCPLCDRRIADEARTIARIRRAIARGRRVRLIATQLKEPRGVNRLARIGTALVDADRDVASSRRVASARYVTAARRSPSTARRGHSGGERTGPPLREAVGEARLIFFGGKGGVGKTTVAAAAAVSLAEAHPDRRILLMSTDPAHSLGDVFASRLSNRPSRPAGAPANLAAREVDAEAALAARRHDLESALDEIASTFGAAGVRIGGRGSELLKIAPPGIDELFGILSVVDARTAFDAIVVDTAPTGHALRLLEMPESARAWVNVLMRVLLKYRSVVRAGPLAAELVDLSKSIRDLQALLHDRHATRFIVVARAAQLPRSETERLLKQLRRLQLATPALVVNAMTLTPRRCRRCRATAAAERRELAALRRSSQRRVIIQTPLTAPPPRGVRALSEWARDWIV
jgi:arsenite/tail-anchored protein-transporting ATPase